jgi:DNA-binding beta-propeller fold protein YncE
MSSRLRRLGHILVLRRLLSALAFLLVWSAFSANAAVAAKGDLVQKPGTAGCISNSGNAGACVDGTALSTALSVAVSPDGKNAYVASMDGDAVAVFDRAGDGTLTQKAGTAGCISDTGAGPCVDGRALELANSVTVSPDGKNVYVTSGDVNDAISGGAVAVFDRAADGTLTQKAGTAGCISDSGSAGACADGTALDGALSVTVSPDGANVYATAGDSDAVAVFDRAGDGTLTQKAGTAGCISDTGAGGCVDGTALALATSVTVSPDGQSAYVSSGGSDAVAVFDRAGDGTLTQKVGTAGCISDSGSAGACIDGTALNGASSVILSGDGQSAYVASSSSSAVSVFDREPNGTLTQKAGTAGCISDGGDAGSCIDGTALNGAFSVTLSPDGQSLYVASFFSHAVAIFDRETVDTSSPDTSITSGPAQGAATSDSTPTFEFTASEFGASFECRVDTNAFASCSSPHTTTTLADGTHTFEVRATDPADNTDPTPATRTFTVVVSPPDSDGDGVPDSSDACPAVTGTMGNGCPAVIPPLDSDGDQVPNTSDACPMVAGTAANGCPPEAGKDSPSVNEPAIGGPRSVRALRVSQKRSFMLPKQSVDCSGSGPSCVVRTSITVVGKRVKLGGSSFKVKTGKKRKVSAKLTRKGLKLIRRKRQIKARITITVSRGTTTAQKTVRLTLKAPKAKAE